MTGTTALPYTITTTSDGVPQEEVWEPADTADALAHGFQHWYGLTLSGIGPESEPPVEFIALGHDVDRRALTAAAQRWMRTAWSWTNLLNDSTPGALCFLSSPVKGHVVLLRATQAAGSAYEGQWQAVTVDAAAPGAIPVTVLDLHGPLDNPARLHAQVEHLQAGAWSRRSRPKTVTLCGSTKYWDLMAQANGTETAAGHIVLAPGCNMKALDPMWADPVQAEVLKTRLDRLHRRKVDLADEVLVVTDSSGYVGSSTSAEIAYAHSLGTPVRYTDPAHPDQPVIRTTTVDTWAVQLDNGENLKDLEIGGSVDLRDCADYDGLWIAARFEGEDRDQITLQSAAVIQDCAAIPRISCGWSGRQPHAHPVALDGTLQPLPPGSHTPAAEPAAH